MRASIITFMRISLGVGIFATPYYTSNVGILNGVIMMILTCLLNYYTYHILFRSLIKYKKNNFKDIIQIVLGDRWKKLSIITYILDYSSTILINSITGWNIFQYLCYYSGYLTDSELLNRETL